MGSTTTGKTIRKSIFYFLQNYQHLTSTPTLLAFPSAASYLVSSSYLFPLFHTRLSSISPQLFALDQLNLKLLSQTILTFLLNLVSPFTFTFLLLSRASVIQRKSAILCPFNHLLVAQLRNTLLMLATNATFLFFLALGFGFLEFLGLSSCRGGPLLLSGAVIYSTLVANATCFLSNLALVLSRMGNNAGGGFIPILKAWVMIKDRTASALSLAVAMNTAFTAVEALFRYRVVRAYRRDFDHLIPGLLIITEGIFIAFLYAVFLVIDTVVGCTFWESCTHDDRFSKSKTEMPTLDIIP